MRSASLSLALLTVLIVPSAARVRAADTWVEIQSPNFRVVSNAGEKTARNIAWQFEQFRSAIAVGWPWARVQLNRPVTLVAVKDENSMRLMAPRYWETRNQLKPASIFATGADTYYIALRTDVEAEDTISTNPYQVAYWSYTTLTLDSAFERGLPLWFREGMAQVLSNTIVRSNELQFGRPLPWFVEELQYGRFRLAELMSIPRDSPIYSRDGDRRRFSAQSWALVQFLLYGAPNPELRATRVNELAKRLLAGVPSVTAAEQLFGSLDALDTLYQTYVSQGLFRYTILKVDTKVNAKDFAASTLPAGEALAVRGGFYVATSRPVEARAAIDEGKKAGPTSAAAFAVEGLLLDVERKTDEAKLAYAKAVELGTNNYYPYLRLALLNWTPAGDAASRENRARWLTRSVELNRAFAPASINLASALLALEKPAEALDPARRAVAQDSDNSSYRVTLAEVLWRTGQRDEAMREAQAALALARSPVEQRQAQQLIDSFAFRGGR